MREWDERDDGDEKDDSDRDEIENRDGGDVDRGGNDSDDGSGAEEMVRDWIVSPFLGSPNPQHLGMWLYLEMGPLHRYLR